MAHWLDEQFNLHRCGLDIRLIEGLLLRKPLCHTQAVGTHEAVNLAKILQQAFDHFGLTKENIFCGVTDGAKNYVNAVVDHLQHEHHVCFCHTTNLLAEDMLEQQEPLIEQVTCVCLN